MRFCNFAKMMKTNYPEKLNVNHQEEGQLIIIENLNNIPNLPYAKKGAIIETFQKRKAPVRYGFLNITE